MFGFFDAFLAAAGGGPDWRETWPFGPGYSEGLVSTVLKFGLIAVFFVAIALFLRFLFGPGGWMRDKEFDLPRPKDPASPDSGDKPSISPRTSQRRDAPAAGRTPDDPHA